MIYKAVLTNYQRFVDICANYIIKTDRYNVKRQEENSKTVLIVVYQV